MRHACISDLGAGLIRRHEGCRLTAYRDVVGVWTIGYGHTGPDVQPGLTITSDQATELLHRDLHWVDELLVRLQGERAGRKLARFGPNQLDALADFIFNIGAGAWKASNVYAEALRQRDPTAPFVPALFMTWTLAGGQALPALAERRFRAYMVFRWGHRA